MAPKKKLRVAPLEQTTACTAIVPYRDDAFLQQADSDGSACIVLYENGGAGNGDVDPERDVDELLSTGLQASLHEQVFRAPTPHVRYRTCLVTWNNPPEEKKQALRRVLLVLSKAVRDSLFEPRRSYAPTLVSNGSYGVWYERGSKAGRLHCHIIVHLESESLLVPHIQELLASACDPIRADVRVRHGAGCDPLQYMMEYLCVDKGGKEVDGEPLLVRLAVPGHVLRYYFKRSQKFNVYPYESSATFSLIFAVNISVSAILQKSIFNQFLIKVGVVTNVIKNNPKTLIE